MSVQKFDVNAPRFTLPTGIIHSTYPPQGLGDHNDVLPHIVFEDPHFPWEREGSPRQDSVDDKQPRNKVPWVALLTFTEDELKLSDQELSKRSQGGLFPETTAIPSKSIPPPAGRDQNKSTFSVKLTMGEYLEMGGSTSTIPATVTTPVWNDPSGEPIDTTTQVDVIFPTADLVNALFASYDTTGAPVKIPPSQTAPPDLSRYKYLAHVRNVNTTNIAGAGSSDDGLYSVVYAHRSGPLNLTSPKPIIAHLVTLEGVESAVGETQRLTLPLDPTKRVALVSLYSWTYLCLPPEQVNFLDSMRRIGFGIEAGQCWLRSPDTVIATMKSTTSSSPVATRLAQRMTDGFCLQRYRLQTGEETIAFYRGPLTPTYIPPISESWWPYQSNFSTDYQVLDPDLGIMDITYSAAWQLGRTLAIADQFFTAALVRLRGTIQTTGRRGSIKQQAAQPIQSKGQTLSSLSSSVAHLAHLAEGDAGSTPSDPMNRHRRKPLTAPRFRRKGDMSGKLVPQKEVHQVFYQTHVAETAAKLSSGRPHRAAAAATGALSDPPPPPPSPDDIVYIPFNDINVPVSTDWQIVQNWILDKLFLQNIPAHYFIPDPSYLPLETIRFFYLDANWMDAIIDGALSVGNHLERNDDVVRQALKLQINSYFSTPYNKTVPALNYYPQIPCFGFLLRSAVVKAFPDLEIHCPWPSSSDPASGNREPTLRFETIAPDTLLCLFDRMPGSTHWDPELQITLSQPPHQMCFRLGTPGGLTTDYLEVEFPAIYTANPPANLDEPYAPLRTIKWLQTGGPPVEGNNKPVTDVTLPPMLYDWTTRLVSLQALASASLTIETADNVKPPAGQPGSTHYFTDDTATSALVGNVLTSYVSKMMIKLPQSTSPNQPPDFTVHPRQIRMPSDPSTDPNTFERVPPLPDPDDPDPPAPPPPAPLPSNPGLPTPSRPARVPHSFNMNDSPPVPDSQKAQITDPDKAKITTLSPQFESLVFPLGPPPASGPNGTPPKLVQIRLPKPGSPADIPIDLVVSLNRTPSPDTIHKLQLFYINIVIPVGPKPTDLLLTPGAPPPSAASSLSGTMPASARPLRNVRFNVHVANVVVGSGPSAQAYLQFLVIPRSRSKLVPLAATQETSFVIGQVALNGVAGRASIMVQESYRWQNFNDYYPIDAHAPVVVEKLAPVG